MKKLDKQIEKILYMKKVYLRVPKIKQSILKAIMEKKRVMAHIEGTKRVETPWVTLEDVEEVLK